jgi:hypothetical protein
MGDLKPLGSEKLKGEDKLKRILELTYYKENNNTSSNASRSEVIKESKNGGVYGIVKEKDSYYVKRGLNENSLDYIGGMFMKNKNRFSSYSEALKRLELLKGQEELQEATKYVLKQKSAAPAAAPEETMAPPAEAAAEMPAALPPAEGDAPMSDAGLEDVPSADAAPEMGDMGGLPDAEEAPESGEEGGDESDPLKSIQKLTGKLGQKLRDAQEDMESDDIKYVINSVVSALNLDNLDSEDKEEILNQFEDEEEYEGGEDAPSPEGNEIPSAEPEMTGGEGEMGEEDHQMAIDALEELINTSFGEDEPEEDEEDIQIAKKVEPEDDFKMQLQPGGAEDEYFRTTSRDFSSDFDYEDDDDEDYFKFDIKEEDPIGDDEIKELSIEELTDVISQGVKEALGKYIK